MSHETSTEGMCTPASKLAGKQGCRWQGTFESMQHLQHMNHGEEHGHADTE